MTVDAALEQQIRSAFAGGISAGNAATFFAARDAGLGWEAATRALADGLADHYGTRAEPKVARGPSQPSTLLVLLGALLGYVALRPLLGVSHEVIVAVLAWLAHAVIGTNVWEPVIRVFGLDPIYAGAAIRAAGGVEVAGFAVAGPVGGLLHELIPSFFYGPEAVVGRAAVSMVASPGAPALGRGLAAFGADIVLLTIGLHLFLHFRMRRWQLAVIGLLIQAQVAINHLLGAHIAISDMDASGLPFALQVAVPSGGWVTGDLASLSPDLQSLIVGGVLVIVAYSVAGAVLLVGAAVSRFLRVWHDSPRVITSGATPRWSTAAACLGLAVATAWSPIGALAVGESNWQLAAASNAASARFSAHPGRAASHHTLRISGATPVTIEQSSDTTWQYLVDGVPDSIRGVGYNPWYASLPAAQRTALYDRDFGDMHRLGINTIEGWFEGQFDSVTLDAAARNGIGVLMPFELNQDWDYTNPNVQESVLEHVTDYVNTYKNHPAVRMWAPGNENLHRILYTHWVSQANDPNSRARAEAFAAFLPVLVDRIHQVDPNHPVVYRDAEDVYLPWIVNAFNEAGGGDRPWLVYGANVYAAARLQTIISSWPQQWPGRPLLISEFAPGGMSPADRPLGFEQQWNVIRSRPDSVLGGLAYTWATNGPEDLDRVFGLVDQSGVPTDGGLAALSALYISDNTAVAAEPAGN